MQEMINHQVEILGIAEIKTRGKGIIGAYTDYQQIKYNNEDSEYEVPV